MHKDNILEVKHLHKRFFSKGITVKAVTDVSFDVKPGETIGIVGESGCGKTTLGRCIVRAYEASEGEVLYRTRAGEEVDFLKVDKRKRKEIRKEIQMIFQDPYSSLDPRMTVLDIIKEPLKANYPKMPKAEMDQMAKEMAEFCLPSAWETGSGQFPHMAPPSVPLQMPDRNILRTELYRNCQTEIITAHLLSSPRCAADF